MKYTLYGRDTSYNVQKVLWYLHELDLPYEHIQWGGVYGGTDQAEFLALNPMGKVPVLVMGERSIWESNTILRYLRRTHGGEAESTKSEFEVSLQERWMDWAQTVFEPGFVGVFWGYYRTPEAQRDVVAIQRAAGQCSACLQGLQKQLQGGDYLVGNQLTLADICCGVFLYRLSEIDFPIAFPQEVLHWYQQLQLRPGYKQWVMRDFSELKGRTAF